MPDNNKTTVFCSLCFVVCVRPNSKKRCGKFTANYDVVWLLTVLVMIIICDLAAAPSFHRNRRT